VYNLCVHYSVCRWRILSRTAGRISNPSRFAFVLAVMVLTPRGVLSKAKPSAIFPRQLRPRLPLHIVFPDTVQRSVTELDIARGRFPKEFAINASSPHCASICFRLSTRGRFLRSVVVETNIRTPRAVCDFFRSCVFPRKWRRIDRVYRDLSRDWVIIQRFVFRRFFFSADSLAS